MTKVKKAELRTATVGYLYEDGHLVLKHEKPDRDAGRVEWITVYQNVGIKAEFKGRLIIHQGALPFVLHASRVRATEPRIEGGSDNTKERGIRVGAVSLYNGNQNIWGFHIDLMPDLISGPFTYQPLANRETFEDIKENPYTWGWMSIKAIYEEKAV